MTQYSKFDEIPCANAEELWEKLSPTQLETNAKIIYRGQGDALWKLEPAVLRQKSVVRQKIIAQQFLTADIQIFSELQLLVLFAEHVDSIGLQLTGDSFSFRKKFLGDAALDPFVRDPSKWPTEEYIGFMAMAQHHGIETRLLDWSQRAFVAAYFAATSALSHENAWGNDSKIAIWALNWEGIALYRNVQVLSVPGSTSENLAAQAGMFTLLKERGRRGEPAQSYALEDEFCELPDSPLTKFTLPVSEVRRLLKLCKVHWITGATLFPTYEGAARAVHESIQLFPSSPVAPTADNV